jgi:TolB-like protein/Flp pilus assembly protein TadD
MAGVPYVAVMPFESLGDGERYSYISDGFVDDIITNLSRFPEIAVLARNSTFLYRDADSPDLGHLGVRYQLSGSLRYEPRRLHINVHLLDVDLERVIWSQTYDRPVQEIFSIPDDIVSEVASRLAVSVRAAEASRISRVPEARLAAYELVLLAREVSFRAASFPSTMDARRLAERAISTDPDYADAHVELGRTYYRAYVLEWEGAEALARAQEAAHRAIALDQNSAAAIELLGRVELRLGRVEEALKTLTRALEPNPNRAETYASLADALTFAGRPDEALAMLGKATTLDPLYPPRIEMYLGRAHYFARSYKEARAALETCVARAPQFRPCYMYLVPTLAELGDDVAASSAIAKLLELSPDFSISASVLKHLPYREDPMRHYVSGLEKAGLPL